MNSFVRLSTALASAMMPVAIASAATDSPPRQAAAGDPVFKVLKIGTTSVIEILGTNTTCEPDKIDSKESCEITIRFLNVDGKKYCVAEAPQVNGKVMPGNGNADNIKFINWRLSKTDEDGRPLTFHASAGIVITTDDNEKFVVPNSGGHGHGNGSGGSSHYHVKVKRNIQAAPGYLPIVLWGAGDKAELCAAPDPKIVNN